MNAFLFVITIIVFGFLFDSLWLTAFGIVGLFLALVVYYVEIRRERQPVTVPSGGRPGHKLLQAPEDAWETDDTLTYLSAMSGMRMMASNPPDDSFSAISRVFDEKPGKEIPRDLVRNVLPFDNYGRKTIFEQVFIGLPVNIGTLIRKKRIKKKYAKGSPH